MTFTDDLYMLLTDLAVGSYLSGHALVFRSRPVIKFGLTIKPQSDGLIDPNNGGTITLTACANVHWESSMPEICQSFGFKDVDKLNKKLFGFRLGPKFLL